MSTKRFRMLLTRYAVIIVLGAITIGVITLASCTAAHASEATDRAVDQLFDTMAAKDDSHEIRGELRLLRTKWKAQELTISCRAGRADSARQSTRLQHLGTVMARLTGICKNDMGEEFCRIAVKEITMTRQSIEKHKARVDQGINSACKGVK